MTCDPAQQAASQVAAKRATCDPPRLHVAQQVASKVSTVGERSAMETAHPGRIDPMPDQAEAPASGDDVERVKRPDNRGR